MSSWSCLVVLTIGLAGCASGSGMDGAARLNARMAECSRTTGFDPQRPDIDDHTITPEERTWRECLYQAVRSDIVPLSHVANLYLNLIDADRAMTADISAGTLTRAERKTRLDQFLAEIDDVERAKRQDAIDRLKRERMDDLEREKQIQSIDRILRDINRYNQALTRGF